VMYGYSSSDTYIKLQNDTRATSFGTESNQDFVIYSDTDSAYILKIDTNQNATFAGTVTVSTAGSSITQESWNAPTFTDGTMSNYGGSWETAGYMKDSNGVVHLKGLITGNCTSSGCHLFTLPSGYRPSASNIFTVMTSASPDRAARIDIVASGEVYLDQAHNGWISLSGVSFKT